MTINVGSVDLASGLVGSFVVFSAFALCGCCLTSSFDGVAARLCGRCASIVIPLMVKSEPIHPITPRYIMRMLVDIKGAKASPKVCTRSSEAIIERFCVRNP